MLASRVCILCTLASLIRVGSDAGAKAGADVETITAFGGATAAVFVISGDLCFPVNAARTAMVEPVLAFSGKSLERLNSPAALRVWGPLKPSTGPGLYPMLASRDCIFMMRLSGLAAMTGAAFWRFITGFARLRAMVAQPPPPARPRQLTKFLIKL